MNLVKLPLEILEYYLLPKLNSSAFIAFSICDTETLEIVKHYLKSPRNVKKWDIFNGVFVTYNIISNSIPLIHGKYIVTTSINPKKCLESNYVNGKLHGISTEWHQNGEIKAIYSCKNGRKCGTYDEWAIGGSHILNCVYKKGKLHGKHSRYRLLKSRGRYNGLHIVNCTYKNGISNNDYTICYNNN